MFRSLRPYWWPSRWQTLGGVTALLAAAGLELLLPWPVKWLVDDVIGGSRVPAWAAFVSPDVAGGGRNLALLVVCLSAVVIALAHRLATFISQTALISVGGELVRQLRCRGYDQFCRLSLAYHDKTRVGDSLYRVAYDTQAAMSLVSGAGVPLLQSAFILAGIIVVMARMDPWLTAVAAAVVPVFWLCIRHFGGRIERASRRYHENESLLLSTVQETLSTMRALQAFTREPDTSVQFSAQAGESLAIQRRLIASQLLFAGTIGVALSAGTAIFMWFGAQRVFVGTLSAGDVLVFVAYLGMLYQPLNAISQSLSVFQTARVQLGRVFEVLDASTQITDRPGARPLPRVTGAIEFRDVSFEYDTGEPVLCGVSFSARAGESIALIGRTGAGKTTLASLLLRFYDPTRGAVLLDGVDLRDVPVAWLRQQVSVVLQDALLVSGTIRDNIAYGRPDASLEDVRAAAREAQADEFIQGLPQGYDTPVAERGVNLSGGQKQRLAIARAFLKNAPILVLDEPTSALDVQTEDALIIALTRLMKGRTTFVIAHRLSTIRLADRVMAVEQGRISETRAGAPDHRGSIPAA